MEDVVLKEDILQEYTQFKIVAAMKCKQTDNEHEQKMIMQRLKSLEERYEVYSDKGYDLEKVRALEKKYLEQTLAINRMLFGVEPSAKLSRDV